ncbi:MAG: outer membrane protein assembly factor BamD [Isosphaeraceae bacterium]|nr:outer membrane protein assembly factor BamD [Isosphaeraceae bacterium]
MFIANREVSNRESWTRLRRAARALIALLPLLAAGCQSPAGTLARWRMAHDATLAPGPTREELGNNRSLLERWLHPKTGPRPSDPNQRPGPMLGPDGKLLPPPKDPEAEAEFAAAEALFQRGDLDQAEAAFKRMARSRKDTHWGEKAQFYLAETQFQRGRYFAANDSYEELLRVYPGTGFLDKAVAKEYQIAQIWLASQNPKAKPEQREQFGDRFKGRLPLIDVNGHALQTLEHVRHHDPNGPLADDAVKQIADYHFAVGNYEDAALYYDQLIADHPKSPFVQQALYATIDAKIKGYLGPEYDGTGLEQAREQIKQAMTTMPLRQVGTGEKLYHDLDLINDQDAERSYTTGLFYMRTKKVAAAEFYFGEVIQRWPKSQWAKKSKAQLAKLATMPRTETRPSKIMTLPGSGDPYANGITSGNPNGMGGMPMGGMGPIGTGP